MVDSYLFCSLTWPPHPNSVWTLYFSHSPDYWPHLVSVTSPFVSVYLNSSIHSTWSFAMFHMHFCVLQNISIFLYQVLLSDFIRFIVEIDCPAFFWFSNLLKPAFFLFMILSDNLVFNKSLHLHATVSYSWHCHLNKKKLKYRVFRSIYSACFFLAHGSKMEILHLYFLQICSSWEFAHNNTYLCVQACSYTLPLKHISLNQCNLVEEDED